MTEWILLASLALAGVRLPDGACVTGRVLDAGAKPVAGAIITLLPRWNGALGSVRTAVDGDGAFSLSSLAPGAYWMVVERFGFEPAIQALSLSPSQAWNGDLRVTPLTEFLRVADGRAELPWLLRGTADDPTRLAPDASSRLEGRLGFETVASDAGASLLGQGARLALAGAVRDDLGWYFDGRVDDLLVRRDAVAESVGSNHVRYGIDFTPSDAEFGFRAERFQSSREILGGGEPTQVDERRSSYRFAYRTSPDSSDLGLSFMYREALRGSGAATSTWRDRRSAWEGRGDYSQRISSRHRVRTRVAFLTDDGLATSNGWELSLVPLANWQLPSRADAARRWRFAVVPSWEWEITPSARVASSLDLRRSTGAVPESSARPGILFALAPDANTKLQIGANWLWLGSDASQRQTLRERVGLLVAFERDLENGLALRVEARSNRGSGLDDPSTHYANAEGLLLLGAADSREVRLDLLSRGIAGIRGRIGAAFGSTSGGIGALSLVEGLTMAPDANALEGPLEYATAILGGELINTQTDVTIRYRWLHATTTELEGLEHIDVELAQALPWLMFGGARLDLQLAMRGFVRKAAVSATNTANEETTETALASPVFAAGVGVRF